MIGGNETNFPHKLLLTNRQVANGQGDDYTTGCLLDYIYFKNYYKMIAVG